MKLTKFDNNKKWILLYSLILLHISCTICSPAKSRSSSQKKPVSKKSSNADLPKEDLKKFKLTKPKSYDKIVGAELKKKPIHNPNVTEGPRSKGFSIKGAINYTNFRWHYNMKMKIDNAFAKTQYDTIMSAAWTIEQAMEGCFSFFILPYNRKTPPWMHVMKIKHEKDKGCFSLIGRRAGEQQSVISDNCNPLYGEAMHEIIHALGFVHEHNRPDRDKYVKAIWSEIHDTEDNYQYEKAADQHLYVKEYDFGSIMHYAIGPKLQLRNPDLVPRGVQVGQRSALSASDVTRLRAMYPCSDAPTSDEDY